MADAPTPSMQQYLKAKADHPDCLVLFRMGDFYETFYDDAEEASRILDIALTSRNKDSPNPIPMAGVPHHSVNQYVARLLEARKRVAICEQMEDPKQAKGIVRREVVRVITPGVLLDTELGDRTGSNHLACVIRDDRGWGVATLDASTGAFCGTFVTTRDDLSTVLARLVLREVLLPEDAEPALGDQFESEGVMVTALEAPELDPDKLDETVRGLVPPEPAALSLRRASAAVLAYLARTHPALLKTVQEQAPLPVATTMSLPGTTIRNLEFLRTTADGRTQGSLFHFLNRTRTSMGTRMLRARLLAPLVEVDGINHRLDLVEALVGEPTTRTILLSALTGVPDVERLVTRFAGDTASARDLNAVARSVRAMETAAKEVHDCGHGVLQEFEAVPDGLAELASAIEATIVDEPPAGIRDGGFVRRGLNPGLDEARDLAENGRRYIAEYEAAERESTGITNLKVKYNRVFGYTIEVTKSWQSKVPGHYHRRQTLANAERYTTEALSELEQQVSTAEERTRAMELQIFEDYRDRILAACAPLQELAGRLARLDVVASLADLAHNEGFCRPVVTDTRRLRIIQGRHPIVESALPAGTFVPNDFEMDGDEMSLDIITGPNMAGKSTVMRQVAVTLLMAQMGSFVPADEAELGIADAVFTRVGAMDDLAAGRSTFMVEMSEAAEILSRATSRSLVILDEIGRGTSTFDGVAIAWAVAEYIQNRVGCRTLFATHYHELTELVRSLPRTRNQSIAVKEWGGEVLFLRKLVDGPASKSYGIQVARLAGLPSEVVERSKEVLANLEAGEFDVVGKPTIARGRGPGRGSIDRDQLDLFGMSGPAPPDPLVTRLAGLDPDSLTPLEGLQVLSDLVAEARKKQ
ncbi:MAG: DNA mismatch repair protein MutS [Deltaproteobacteria bacterium]|nr:DNA mismatch repair protein MutS [Deltaproteobacteria bacterium]